MSIETETLKTLERIEELLERSLVSGKSAVSNKRAALAGSKKQDGNTGELNKAIFLATRRLNNLEKSADKVSRSLHNTREDVSLFRKSIRASTSLTSAAFNSLNSAIAEAAKSMTTKPEGKDESKPVVSKNLATLGRVAELAGVELGRVYRSATLVNKAFGQLVGSTTKGVIPAQQKQKKSTDGVTDANNKLGKSTNKQSATTSLIDGVLSRFGVTTNETGNKSEWLSGQFSNLGYQLSDAIINITRDIYALQARGIDAGESLFSLYGTAMKAGMSLEEYTSMLSDNSAAVVRATSMVAFRDSLRTTTDSLKQIGVFGPAANQLAAAMRTNSVQLGVPISQVDDVAKKQVETFKELRKTTMMTAEGFKELIDTVSNNQNVQEDLLGLAPSERAARQQQLLQIGSLGHRLGLTQQASAQLTDALLAQRKATAQQRFQAAGLIRQAGAMTGMGAGETEELAKLRMKKRRSPEEEARFTELSGRLEERLQTMMNSGNIQAEFLAEKMGELLGSTPQGQMQEAAGKALLQSQSGAPQNADIGKETPQALQNIGEVLTTLSGFMKNPLADAMVTFGSMLVQAVWQVSWLKKIYNRLGGAGGASGGKTRGTKDGKGGGIFDRMRERVGGKGGPGILGRMKGGLSTVAGGVAAAGGAASSKLASFGKFFAETTMSAGGIDISDGPKREKGIGDRIAKQNEAAKAKKGSVFSRLGKAVNASYINSIDMAMDTDGMGGNDVKLERGVTSKMSGKMMNLAKGGVKALFTFGGPLALIGRFWDVLDEVFTGNLGAAFGEAETASVDFKKAGWLWDLGGVVVNKLDDMVMAVFRGAATIFTDLGDVVLHAVGVDTKELIGGSLTNWFDKMLTDFIGTWKQVKINAMETANSISGFFGFKAFDDATIKESEKELEATIETRQKLTAAGNATLTSIGEENNKVLNAQKDAAKKAAAETSVASAALRDDVVHGVEGLAASAQRTVQAVQASTPGAQVATPGPTKQSGVTPPETVNKTQVEEEKKKEEQSKKPDAAPQQSELLTVAQLQLDVLRQMLAFWMSKEDVEEVLGRIKDRPSMESGSVLFGRAIGG